MTNENLLTISVFSNHSMTDCLVSYQSDGIIYEVEDDLLDDEDWWNDYAAQAEDMFGSRWAAILIKSNDESHARVIDRNYYLNGEINNNHFVYHDKLFLIGESSSKNLSSYFSGHIVLNYKLNEVNSFKYYQKGYDETIISLLKVFVSDILSQAKVVDVVYNPTAQSLLAMKLSDHYKYMVHIPTRDKVNELIGLTKAMKFTGSIYQEMLQARRIAKGYDTSELNFMMHFINEIENKINFESDGSFYKIFKEKFCI